MELDIHLIPNEELNTILPLVKTLNPNLADEILKERLQEMTAQGYRCAGAYLRGELIAICGMWITTRFYSGKQIEPDNVIVIEAWRGHGIGQRLMQWVYAYGREQNCLACELNAYVVNSPAHRFYFQQGFKILGYHFQRSLGSGAD
jgi:GNAT superfamily N-acetyltransferase